MYQTRIVQDLATEPVTLAETKEFMHIDFPDFDVLITLFIKSARIASEKFTGLSYGEKTIELVNKGSSCVSLPLGPVTSIESVKDKDGNDLEYVSFGFDNPLISLNNESVTEFSVIYKAGFETCPEDLKEAIKRRTETAFQFRSDAVKSEENLQNAVNQSVYTELSYRQSPMFGL